jgi:hypothetical protein
MHAAIGNRPILSSEFVGLYRFSGLNQAASLLSVIDFYGIGGGVSDEL